MDPRNHLQVVRDMLERALEGSLAPKQRAAVEAAVDALALAQEGLQAAQDLVVLTDLSMDDLDMDAARAAWAAIPEDAETRELDSLRSASPTLHALHRAGIDLISVRRYGAQHVEVARLLGERCAGHPEYVRNLARTDHPSSSRFNIDPDAVGDMVALLRRLEEWRVLANTKLWGEIPGTRPFWVEHAKLRPHVEPSRWQVQRGAASKDYASFFGGHWLTAYAYLIAADQFNRAERPFEIYSNLAYRLPWDMGGGRSDIDVLVRRADKVLLIECKSGPVLAVHHGKPAAIERAAETASAFDRVLTKMDIRLERHYVLVHAGHESNEQLQDALGKLDTVPVVPVLPGELRSLVNSFAVS